TLPAIAIRTGDTPAAERARFNREAADILITTPESLFLLLTSRARERLASIDTVIIDEIHALVPGKRGTHLALSLERLEALKAEAGTRVQRIGLSATVRPIDEVARFLGGAEPRRSRKTRGSSRHTQSRSTTGPKAIDDIESELYDEFASDEARPTFRPVTILVAFER